MVGGTVGEEVGFGLGVVFAEARRLQAQSCHHRARSSDLTDGRMTFATNDGQWRTPAFARVAEHGLECRLADPHLGSEIDDRSESNRELGTGIRMI